MSNLARAPKRSMAEGGDGVICPGCDRSLANNRSLGNHKRHCQPWSEREGQAVGSGSALSLEPTRREWASLDDPDGCDFDDRIDQEEDDITNHQFQVDVEQAFADKFQIKGDISEEVHPMRVIFLDAANVACAAQREVSEWVGSYFTQEGQAVVFNRDRCFDKLETIARSLGLSDFNAIEYIGLQLSSDPFDLVMPDIDWVNIDVQMQPVEDTKETEQWSGEVHETSIPENIEPNR